MISQIYVRKMLPNPNAIKLYLLVPTPSHYGFRSPFACVCFAIPVGSLSLPTPLACSLHLRNVGSTWLHKISNFSSANKMVFRVGKGIIAQEFYLPTAYEQLISQVVLNQIYPLKEKRTNDQPSDQKTESEEALYSTEDSNCTIVMDQHFRLTFLVKLEAAFKSLTAEIPICYGQHNDFL